MQIVARIEGLNQIGPDDFRVEATTKIFEDTVSVQEILTWAKRHGKYTPNQIELTQPV